MSSLSCRRARIRPIIKMHIREITVANTAGLSAMSILAQTVAKLIVFGGTKNSALKISDGEKSVSQEHSVTSGVLLSSTFEISCIKLNYNQKKSTLSFCKSLEKYKTNI